MLLTECQVVGLVLAQGGRAEAEALSDISLLPESAERTGEPISDTPGYCKQNKVYALNTEIGLNNDSSSGHYLPSQIPVSAQRSV